MGQLKEEMPVPNISRVQLKKWGRRWLATRHAVWEEKWTGRGRAKVRTLGRSIKDKQSHRFNKAQSLSFGQQFDRAFGEALANFLGDIPVLTPKGDSLLPVHADCVEVGTTRVVGGIRPQNYDAAYRPDGPRVVFDSKSLNDTKSIAKNWQNMINDLATEAATIHTRFPYAVVAFMVILPRPALAPKQEADIIRTLERLGTRNEVLDQHHLAEAIALVIWDPATGEIDAASPGPDSILSLSSFSRRISTAYFDRYKGLPPHAYTAPEEEEVGEYDEPA